MNVQGDFQSLQVFVVSVLLLFRFGNNAVGTKTAFQMHGEKHLVKCLLVGAGNLLAAFGTLQFAALREWHSGLPKVLVDKAGGS